MTNGHEDGRDAASETKRDPRAGWLYRVEQEVEEIAQEPPPALFLHVLKIDLPYIVMLLAAVFGIGMATFTGEMTPVYWEILTPLYAVICIHTGWRRTEDREARIRLVWTQAAHWLAVLVAMYVIYLPRVQDVMNNNAAGITLMTILALATVLAGIHASTWQTSAVGLVLAISIPIIAWIQQSALILTVISIVLVFALLVGASLWWTTHKEKTKLSDAAG
ncbi:hypothetical protein [Methylosinus sp. PW1]|uniref:hypothetical protein n=1 Tax=Methylosinus sp. PW1 TaxID=107636 RepID=UPI000691716A|nr:hypothetical protein [Methylosinus sp. PW1]